MKILKKSAPTLKRSQNGRFTPILYMFSLCHFQVQSEWLRVSCDDDGGSGGDENEGDDEEEEERRGGLGAGGAKKTRRL